MNTNGQDTYSIGEYFGIYDDGAATAEAIREACKELVSHPGRYQGLTPEKAYYHVLSENFHDTLLTVGADDFDIWGTLALAIACSVTSDGFAVVMFFNGRDAEAQARDWLDADYDNNGCNW